MFSSVNPAAADISSNSSTRFHPPDGKEFETPYSTDFWPNDFKDRFRNGKGDL